MRVFVAVNFPVAVVRRIADELALLRAEVAKTGWRVAWVPAPNLHLTLKFLGEIPEVQVDPMRSQLGPLLAARAPFELTARGLGAFPDLESPRVIWVGVEESAAIAALQQEVEGALGELGFAREGRPFHPHVTLGRVKHPGERGELAPILERRREVRFGGGRIDELVIYQSVLEHRGAEYRALARLPLGHSRGGKG